MNNINENISFINSDFSNQCLIGMVFIGCKLNHTNFSGADLSYAQFINCDLYCTNFNNSILYSCIIKDCDCTKASFREACLNGIKVQNVIIPHIEFDDVFVTGKERKQNYDLSLLDNKNIYKISIGSKLGQSIQQLEEQYDGIYCNNILIIFIDPQIDQLRVWKRKSEIANIIKMIYDNNGYKDKAIDYYYYQRKFQRKSYNSCIKRMFEYLFQDFFWGYGVRILNPIKSFCISIFIFSLIYAVLPYLDSNSGLLYDEQILKVFDGSCLSMSTYLDILYNSFLISSLSIFGSTNVIGYAKLFVVIQILIAILLLGLGVAALGKKMSNV